MFSSRADIGQLVQSYTFHIREENDFVCRFPSDILKYLFENQVLTFLHVFLWGVHRSDIQDRYRFDTGIFCWIGVSVWRDRSKFDILHS